MARAIITIYITKCAKMNPQQLPKTSKFYSRSKKCDIEKTLGGGVGTTPLVARRLNCHSVLSIDLDIISLLILPAFDECYCIGQRCYTNSDANCFHLRSHVVIPWSLLTCFFLI